MNSSKAKICLALVFWITSSFFTWQSPQVPVLAESFLSPNNIVVVPGTDTERCVLTSGSETWLNDNVRITTGFFVYKIPMLSNAPFVLDFESSGPCNVEVSIGGDLWNSVYNSGVEAGSIKDHIRRQIKIDQQPNNPFLVRFTRTKGAGTPFYLLRFCVLRQLEIYPGTPAEVSHIADPGKSSLVSGGGRLIPAGTSVSYSLAGSTSDKTLCLVENEGDCDIKLDGAKLEPIWTQNRQRLYLYDLVKPSDSKLSIEATKDSRLVRISFFYSFTNIDPTSELGKIFQECTTSLCGADLSTGLSINTLGLGNYISLNCSSPASVKSGSTVISTKKDMAWFETNQSEISIQGEGIVYSWSFDSDTDNDDLPTTYETIHGTDPLFNDTDRDTIIDSKDLFPLDKDNDGVDDSVEAFIGSSSASFDSNNDGIADGLGLDGATKVEMCERVTDEIRPGPKYFDTSDPKMLQTCRLFGNTSYVVPFKDLLLSRNPESLIKDWISTANKCYGLVLDDCAIRQEYWSDPVFIDTFQVKQKRLWTDPTVDDEMAFKLGEFSVARVSELIQQTRDLANQNDLELAVTLPSFSDNSLTTWEGLDGIDRIIINSTDTDESFVDAIKDGNKIGKSVFVQLPTSGSPENARGYISGIMTSSSFAGTSFQNSSPMYVARNIGTDQSTFVQIIADSSSWSTKLDKSVEHPDWFVKLYEQEMYARPCPVAKLGSAKTAFIDEGTTFPTFDEARLLAEWIKKGGSLLVYQGKTRFSNQVWWGTRSTLGKELANLLELREIETEKVVKVGLGNILLTSVEPTNSIPRFFTDILESIPKTPCYYCAPGMESIESGFVSVKYLQKQDMPRYPNPIYVPVERDHFPYVITSTCAVPWVGKNGSKVNILAQAPKGVPSIIVIGLTGEPKAVTATGQFESSFQNGILTLTFTGSGGGDAFAIDTNEALDLKAVSCVVNPATIEEGQGFSIIATIQNVSKIPSSQFSVTFHIDSPVREKQIKRVQVDTLAPGDYKSLNFDVPAILDVGDHRIFIVIVADGEINLGNNTAMCNITVKAKAKQRKIVMQIGNTKASIDGKESILSSPPFITGGKTMVPFRFIAEALDAQVSWDGNEKMVTIIKEDTTIYLWIGKNYAIVSGKMVDLSTPPMLKNGSTFVPIRFISESLGAKVDWEPLSQTITITMQLKQQ